MKSKIITTLLSAALLAVPSVWAEPKVGSGAAHTKVTKQAIKQEQKNQTDLLKEVNVGVSQGAAKVIKAIRLLDENKDKEALAELQAATGKFDIALAAKPELALVPVDSFVKITELVTTPDKLKEQLKLARKMLADGKVQVARELLEAMQDELRISIVYLPMATYPDAIKLATKYLLEEKKEDAKAILITAINTLVTEDEIIPLGLIRSKSLVDQASKLDKKTDKNTVQELLKSAKEQLEIAKLLGYTDENSVAYEDLKGQVEALEKEVKGKNAVEKLYEKIAHSFNALIKKQGVSNKVEK